MAVSLSDQYVLFILQNVGQENRLLQEQLKLKTTINETKLSIEDMKVDKMDNLSNRTARHVTKAMQVLTLNTTSCCVPRFPRNWLMSMEGHNCFNKRDLHAG
ncbi:Hypothetical predicted protein [Paramuricea clavata]|uniref:Uncharacterized protein n=1 Tax=Paramuricea clavata TaxID=317549 RepID=A0A7D9E5T8_PARCT|nr:Hypothetical predicted protein [Paramuricea clavata]